MTDRKKLELIDRMIGDYYEFCSFDNEGMNSGSLQMLIGSIEAVLAFDAKDDEESCGDLCCGECCCFGCDEGKEDEEKDDDDGHSVIGMHVYIPHENQDVDKTEIIDELGEAIHEFLMRALEDTED